MPRNAKQISSTSFPFVLGALLGLAAASPILATAQDSPSQQTISPIKPSSTQGAAHLPSSPKQKTFSSPQQAAQSLHDAARNHDENALLAILGPGAHDIVIWTDNSADRNAQDDVFTRKYEQMHRLVKEPDNEITLYVGAENWPLPIPIVGREGAWYFDSNLGRREILYRRIGENEMDAIDALHGIMDAENQYFDDNSEFAQHLNCSPGHHDGLFSPGNKSDDSPLGPYVAEADFARSDRTPFHGYYFLILTEQGPHTHGGARNYIVNGKMTSGFAIAAFPAVYRSSGVKTFVVNEHGMIQEKDLGPNTTQIASAMKLYDPDGSWTRVRPGQFLSSGSALPKTGNSNPK
jgi:hypothetical protein